MRGLFERVLSNKNLPVEKVTNFTLINRGEQC